MAKYRANVKLRDGYIEPVIEARDYVEARRTFEAQYPGRAITAIHPESTPIHGVAGHWDSSRENSARGGGDAAGVLLFFGLAVVVLVIGPLVVVAGGPAWLLVTELSARHFHNGIILVAALLVFGVTASILTMAFATLPRMAITVVGAAVYGAAGIWAGSDYIWSAIAAVGYGAVGAFVFRWIGDQAREHLHPPKTAVSISPARDHFPRPLKAETSYRDVLKAKPRGVSGDDVDHEVGEALRVLGLGADAAPADVRRQYASLLKKFHPDMNGGDRSFEKLLGQVKFAYEVLTEAGYVRAET